MRGIGTGDRVPSSSDFGRSTISRLLNSLDNKTGQSTCQAGLSDELIDTKQCWSSVTDGHLFTGKINCFTGGINFFTGGINCFTGGINCFTGGINCFTGGINRLTKDISLSQIRIFPPEASPSPNLKDRNLFTYGLVNNIQAGEMGWLMPFH
ncbi:hypothetical protein PCANC_03824 [Puccinia coronata f. sp. avenae]|uniref:Uncharacterized protein n=1 Tax=Puccinia coronata f. sp. avenae TaxID=200324 RepID=A0A2N5T7D0_9BASI|nr:hypothetical protein PCANC_03824 [Puccinia coronata f. sp. avenae]PLW50784.1 hypothetical protein PCASD_00721 [Puccinia coronata f. sp. avenae]